MSTGLYGGRQYPNAVGRASGSREMMIIIKQEEDCDDGEGASSGRLTEDSDARETTTIKREDDCDGGGSSSKTPGKVSVPIFSGATRATGVAVAIKREEDRDRGGGGVWPARDSDALGLGVEGPGATGADVDSVGSGEEALGSDDAAGRGAIGADSTALIKQKGDRNDGRGALSGTSAGDSDALARGRYPAGCPVAFDFHPSPRGRGDVDFQLGTVKSVQMDPSSMHPVLVVEQGGRKYENVKLVRTVREDDIGYASGCPVTIRMAGGRVNADGEIMFSMPKFDGECRVESISYAVMLSLEGNKRRIVSNVPASLVKYKKVGVGVDGASNEGGRSAEETRPIPRPLPKTVEPPHAAGAKRKGRKERISRSYTEQSARETQPASKNRPTPVTSPTPAAGSERKRRKEITSHFDVDEKESYGDYKELKVGSRVNVLFRGTEWQATILGDKVKKGRLGVMVHWRGSKKNSRDWVSVDRVVSLIPGDGSEAKKRRTM